MTKDAYYHGLLHAAVELDQLRDELLLRTRGWIALGDDGNVPYEVGKLCAVARACAAVDVALDLSYTLDERAVEERS